MSDILKVQKGKVLSPRERARVERVERFLRLLYPILDYYVARTTNNRTLCRPVLCFSENGVSVSEETSGTNFHSFDSGMETSPRNEHLSHEEKVRAAISACRDILLGHPGLCNGESEPEVGMQLIFTYGLISYYQIRQTYRVLRGV